MSAIKLTLEIVYVWKFTYVAEHSTICVIP